MNGNGLPDKLKIAFPNLITINRPFLQGVNSELLKLESEKSKSWLSLFPKGKGAPALPEG
jgi:hypothetical protein